MQITRLYNAIHINKKENLLNSELKSFLAVYLLLYFHFKICLDN